MKVITKTMKFILPVLCALGLSTNMTQASTLTDLQNSCPQCHDVIVSPSGWILNSAGGARRASEKTVPQWIDTIRGMSDISYLQLGATSIETAAQFLYDRQYTSAVSSPLATITVTNYNSANTANVGQHIQFVARGTYSSGASQL